MRRETWTPIRPDGTLDEAELRRPAETAEPTMWEAIAPMLGKSHADFVVMLVRTAAACPRHRFWCLFGCHLPVFVPIYSCPGNLVIAAGPIDTQAEADHVLPALLAVKAARREAVFAPREAIEIESCFLTGEYAPRDFGGAMAEEMGPKLDAIRVRGGETPMLPAHVRALRDQAAAAGVPFSLSWGAWSWLTEPDAQGKGGARVRLVGGGGCTLDGAEYPEDGA